MELPKIYKQRISETTEKNDGECVYKKKERLERELQRTKQDIKYIEHSTLMGWRIDTESSPELFTEEEIYQLKRHFRLDRIFEIKYNNDSEEITIGFDKLYKKFRVGTGSAYLGILLGFGNAEVFSEEGTLEEIINNETIKSRIINYDDFCNTLEEIADKFKEF